MSSKKIKLQITFAGVQDEVFLQAGQTLHIGRSYDNDIVIEDKAVSSRHLKLWISGLDLVILDLESGGQTARMPQEKTFVEGRFPLHKGELKLELGKKIPIEFSWEQSDTELSGDTQLSETNFSQKLQNTLTKLADESQLTRTILEKDPTKISVTRVLETKTIELEGEEPKINFEKNLETTTKHITKKVSLPISVSKLPNFLLAIYVVFSLGVFFFGVDISKVVLSQQGVYFDYLIIWTTQYALPLLYGAMFVLLVFVVCVLLGKYRLTILKALLISIILIVAMGLPFLVGLKNSLDFNTMVNAIKLAKIYQFKERIDHVKDKQLLSDLAKEVQELGISGSSFSHLLLYEVQKNRSLKACGGLGETDWMSKKACLTLLMAVNVDLYRWTKPILIDSLLRNFIYLQSLDGIQRILLTEKHNNQKSIQYFVNALVLLDLGDYVDSIQSIVKQQSSAEEKITQISSLRTSVDKNLYTQLKEAKLPKLLRFHMEGPLELGI